MIVDCHTHIFECGHGGPFDLPASAEDLVRDMDLHGIDMSVVLPLPGMADNRYVHEQCARFPDRLAGLYTPEFGRSPDPVARMEEFFQQYQPRGLKIHPRWQSVTVKDTVVRDALVWAAERGLPVLVDVFPYGEDLLNTDLHPLAYCEIARELPALKLILAHSGGYKVMEAFLAAKSHPNIYLDVSFTPVYFRGSSVAADLRFVCSRLSAGRMLYGSDFPYVRIGEHLEVGRALVEGLDENVQAMLFGGAACRLLTLPGAPAHPSDGNHVGS